MTDDNDTPEKEIAEMTEEEKNELFREEALPHLNALYNYAMSISRSKQDAEDLVQDTFMRAYRYFHQYTPGTNCKAWLFTILRNLYNTQYKKYKRTPDQVHYENEEEIYDHMVEENLTSVIKDPEHEFFDNILPKEIVEAIEDLPEDFRETLILADLEDFSYKEISDILDCPIGTVMSRLHRARDTLKKKLVNYARERGVIDEELEEELEPEEDDER
ncbi:MAG: sigma-70 family RNA polymerase sigma factor [bacterium]